VVVWRSFGGGRPAARWKLHDVKMKALADMCPIHQKMNGVITILRKNQTIEFDDDYRLLLRPIRWSDWNELQGDLGRPWQIRGEIAVLVNDLDFNSALPISYLDCVRNEASHDREPPLPSRHARCEDVSEFAKDVEFVPGILDRIIG